MPRNEENENIRKLEEIRGSTVVPLLLDESTSIDRYLVSEVYDTLTTLDLKENIDVIIHSSGGDLDAAYHLGRIFQDMCEGKLTMIIPRYAKSAATALACAGDTIAMSHPSELGPVDPQAKDPTTGEWISVDSVNVTLRILQSLGRGPLLEELARTFPLMVVGDLERVKDHAKRELKALLARRMFKEEENKAEEVAKELVEGYRYHGKCITKDEAKEIGLKIDELSGEEWRLVWKLYRDFEKGELI